MKTAHLIVFRFSAFGDVAMMLPVFRCLFQQYPNVKITLVTRAWTAPLFDEFPQLEVLPLDPKEEHKGIQGLYRLFKTIKSLRPNGIADLHGVLRTHILRVFFFFSFISFRQIDKGRREKQRLTRAKNKVFQPLTPTVYRYADVFRRLGFPVHLEQHEYPPQPLLPAVFSTTFSNPQHKWIGVAPFASFEGKTYPLDLMQKVVTHLQKGHQVFLFGAGEKEKTLLEVWENAMPNAFSMAGKYGLGEELALIAHLDLMLSMDSANAHLAANYGVEVITLWGLTHPFAGFGAFGQIEKNNLCVDRTLFPKIPTSVYGNKTPEGYEKAFRSLDPKKVIETVLERLA